MMRGPSLLDGMVPQGDRIPRGRDTLEVVKVRERDDSVTLVVKPAE